MKYYQTINSKKVEFTTGFMGQVYISKINGRDPERHSDLPQIKETLTEKVREDFLNGDEDRLNNSLYYRGAL